MSDSPIRVFADEETRLAYRSLCIKASEPMSDRLKRFIQLDRRFLDLHGHPADLEALFALDEVDGEVDVLGIPVKSASVGIPQARLEVIASRQEKPTVPEKIKLGRELHIDPDKLEDFLNEYHTARHVA